jgi:hypothetical protein
MKIKQIHLLFASVVLCAVCVLATTNCKKDPVAPTCDTVDVSFKNDIQPLLVSKGCMATGCHAAGSSYPYATYAGLKAAVTAGRLIGAIKREANFSPMPKNGAKLDSCSINIMSAWVTQGAKDN